MLRQLWQSKMPLYMVEENKQNLRKLRGIFIDYGEHEEFSHIRILRICSPKR
jgi:hypothetical protein